MTTISPCFEGWSYTSEGILFRPSGKACSRKPDSKGYLQTKVDGKQYRQHRIIFFLHNGY